MKISTLPTKFAVAWAASAGPSYIRAIPLGSQIGITNGAASLTDGFPPLNFLPVGSGGVPPFGQDMNGILKQITQWSQRQNAGSLVQYDSGFSAAIGGYPFGSLLAGTTAGVVWLSTVDDNTSNPDTGGANWTNIGAQVSSILVGADTGSANVVTANVVPAPSGYADGQIFVILKSAFANNGAMTGNIQSLGSKPIVNMDGTALTPGQWPASGTGILEYNLATTSFRLLNPAVTVAANSGLAVTGQQVLSLSISSLPTPTGALSLSDTIAQQVVSDGAARKVTLQQVATTIGFVATSLPPAGARRGLKIITTSVTAGTITAAELVLEDGSGFTYRASAVNVSYSITSSGANGLDTGTEANSTWYYEWIIYNPSTLTVASLLSLSATAPTMPSGYTAKARVGAIYNDASGNLRFKLQYDKRAQIVVGTNPTKTPIMASGGAGSVTTPTWVAVAVGSFVPPTASEIHFTLFKADEGYAIVAPNPNYGQQSDSTNPPFLSGFKVDGNIDPQSTTTSMLLESTNIYWAATATSPVSALAANGWTDNL